MFKTELQFTIRITFRTDLLFTVRKLHLELNYGLLIELFF